MEVTIEQLRAKANGTINALDTMSAKEREKIPTVSFAEDFNKFRAIAIQVKPEIEAIAPAAIQFNKSQGFNMPKATYVEILAYWRQMIELL